MKKLNVELTSNSFKLAIETLIGKTKPLNLEEVEFENLNAGSNCWHVRRIRSPLE